jgi:hypothetical protein
MGVNLFCPTSTETTAICFREYIFIVDWNIYIYFLLEVPSKKKENIFGYTLLFKIAVI